MSQKHSVNQYLIEAFTTAVKSRLWGNLAANCLPEDLRFYELAWYEDFPERRRGLMAAKVWGYYEGL